MLDQIDHPKKVGQSLCVHGGDSEKQLQAARLGSNETFHSMCSASLSVCAALSSVESLIMCRFPIGWHFEIIQT